MKQAFTPAELAGIWKQIQGSTPGLYVPVPRARQIEKLGTRLAVFRSTIDINQFRVLAVRVQDSACFGCTDDQVLARSSSRSVVLMDLWKNGD